MVATAVVWSLPKASFLKDHPWFILQQIFQDINSKIIHFPKMSTISKIYIFPYSGTTAGFMTKKMMIKRQL